MAGKAKIRTTIIFQRSNFKAWENKRMKNTGFRARSLRVKISNLKKNQTTEKEGGSQFSIRKYMIGWLREERSERTEVYIFNFFLLSLSAPR